MLDGALLPLDSFIRDFQKGKVGYVANALEQPLLLPQDMADLRSLKKHKMFLTLKRDLAMVSLILYYPCFFFFFFYILSVSSISSYSSFLLLLKKAI